MKKFVLFMITLLIMCAFCFTVTANEQKTKTTLKVVSSMPEVLTQQLLSDFGKKMNVGTELTYMPSGTMENKLTFLEGKDYDVWLGGTTEEFWLAKDRELLVSYTPKRAYTIPYELRHNSWFWTALYVDHIGFLSNRKNLMRFGLYAPRSMEELLHKRLKNQIILQDPNNGGASYGMITSLWQLQGEEKALSYAEDFRKQNPTYTECVEDAIDAVLSGKKTVAVVPLSVALKMWEKEKPLYGSVPSAVNKNIISGVAILKGSNTTQAQELIEYLLSDDASKLIASKGHRFVWNASSAPMDKKYKIVVGRLNKSIDDLNWTAGEKESIIKQWVGK